MYPIGLLFQICFKMHHFADTGNMIWRIVMSGIILNQESHTERAWDSE